MVTLQINSIGELKALQAKFRSLRAIYPMLQESSVKEVSEEILDEIQTKMNQNNFSDKIIDATFVGRIEKAGNLFRTHFISDFVSDTGFDVSSAREEGTTQTKKIVPADPAGALRWQGKSNNLIIRKSSRPKGIERLLIIENTIKENEASVSARAGEFLSQKIRTVLGV